MAHGPIRVGKEMTLPPRVPKFRDPDTSGLGKEWLANFSKRGVGFFIEATIYGAEGDVSCYRCLTVGPK